MSRPVSSKTTGDNKRKQTEERLQADAHRSTPRGPEADILALQDAAGNRAVSSLLQAKLAINRPGDRFEQEADRMAQQVARAVGNTRPQGEPQDTGQAGETPFQAKRAAIRGPDTRSKATGTVSPISGEGAPLPPSTRRLYEERMGHDLSAVRVHQGTQAAAAARALNARAFTTGRDIVFNNGEYAPESARGRQLLAHELTHVIQQGGAPRVPLNGRERVGGDVVTVNPGREGVPSVQRNEDESEAERELTGPLTEREWELVQLWLSRGEVGIEPLTDDPAHNAEVVAEAIFCGRLIRSPRFNEPDEDPLLCVIPEVTRADPRVRQLVQHVTARGPIINWARVDPDQRMVHVMELLVDQYGYPVNGAAGLVGNLWAESGVLPSRVEGSRPETPMRARDFAGQMRDFTGEQVMQRDPAARRGPRRPGVGLAQWTSQNRREGLFQHRFQGEQLGARILFNMDAQVDYLVNELQARYPHVDNTLRNAGVSVNDASDQVVYRFEIPGAILDDDGNLLPRNHPNVQQVFARRRAHAQRALRAYREAQRED